MPISATRFRQSIWWHPEYGVVLRRAYRRQSTDRVWRLRLHTLGWSGNEEIIGALKENMMFWQLTWEESKRGGHYKFDIRDLNWGPIPKSDTDHTCIDLLDWLMGPVEGEWAEIRLP